MNKADMQVTLIDSMGSDLSVVNAARVSFDKESKWEEFYACKADGEDGFVSKQLSEKDVKLINYIAKHNHWSPFAHTSLQFRISAPIFVARQLVKHQVGGVWNEVSRRYVDDEPSFYFPSVFRGKPVNAKQGSSDVDLTKLKFMVNGNKEVAEVHAFNAIYELVALYKQMIHNDFAPEQARMFLPQNTMTEWIWSGSLAAFSRVCKLRLDSHAQAETQEVASLIQSLLQPIFPVSWKALQGVQLCLKNIQPSFSPDAKTQPQAP